MDEKPLNTTNATRGSISHSAGEAADNSKLANEHNKHVSSANEATAEKGVAEPEVDVNVVDWGGPDDPENPQNWTALKKWLNIGVVSLITFTIPLASSMFAPAVPQLVRSFDVHSDTLSTLVVSIYVLGMAIGPLVLAPLSELYGRVVVYHAGNVLFIIFTVACALATNMNMLVAFRFLSGLVGAGPIAIGGGTIADVATMNQRARAMSIWSLGPLVGPSVGPVVGGFLSEAKGWRWVFWLLAIIAGAITCIALLVLRETHAPTILRRKLLRLKKQTGNQDLRLGSETGLSASRVLVMAITRPAKMLLLPISLLLSIYSAFSYAMIYLMFSTFSFIFEDNYHFSLGISGLVYLACGIGMVLGLVIYQASGEPIRRRLAENGVNKPEHRIPPMFLGGLLLPAGLFLYGWTAQYHVQWAVPMLGTLITGIGICIINICINMFLIDSFTVFAASALAATAVLRSVFAAVFPLFALQMYNSLGLGWGNSLLAFIALGLWPMTLVFFFYGERLRTATKVAI